MMSVFALITFIVLLLAGCIQKKLSMNPLVTSLDKYMKNVTQLTFDGDNGEAYFSPDGRKLIFQSNRGGYACDKIWIMNIDGSEKQMVSPGHGAHTCAFFFPDGQKIVFASTSHLPGDCPPRPKGTHFVWPLYNYDIFVANTDGSGLKRITDNPKYDAEAVVSPDGRQIVFSSQRDGDIDIYIMNSDGTNVRRLTERIGYDGGPWFSPDGSKIVWRAWYPETDEEMAKWRQCMENDYIIPVPLDIWVMDVDGSNKRRILHNGATNWAPSWHPDGKRIIFSSNMDDWCDDKKKFGKNFELYIINIDGTGLKRITYNNVFDSFPMFSPDGKKIVFASNRNPQNPHATHIFIADWIEEDDVASAFPQATDKIIHHDLKVVLYPKEHRFSVENSITLPQGFLPEFQFSLHSGLNPSLTTPGASIVRVNSKSVDVPIESFRVKLPPGVNTFGLRYGGSIYHAVKPYGKGQARGFSHTPGIISEEGIYLSGSSYWYPVFDEGFITFTLEIKLPSGWDAVSQGERTLHAKGKDVTYVRWESPEPQNEIFVVASTFTEYTKPAGRILAMVFLRTPDEKLADKYLNATEKYIDMYESLIGPYPYKKFALVENFYETGLGMPSFTLLGLKVIRFPFIINSSYPHEILHSWWGNGVFPDLMKGNWSEGLTAYLSDHLIKEQQGNAVEYRWTTLQKYADYVLDNRDFPLSEFRHRYSFPSEAVGYGKSLMFFHMLRQRLGDQTFIAGLKDFYQKNKFRIASFDELKKSFEEVSRKDLSVEFNQWITRQGAPKLRLSGTRVSTEANGYVLTALIEQIQPEEPYLLHIPIAVTMEGQKQAYQAVKVMDKRRLELRLHLPSRPLRLDVDPEFDLFRRLDREEIPPALSQALGAEKMLVLLPSSTDRTILQAYEELARVLSTLGPDVVEVRLDSEVEKLPSDHALTILGWENRFFGVVVSALSTYDVTVNQKVLHLGKNEIPLENHSVVLTARNPENKDMAITFIATTVVKALSGLGRKLPHYHKYSYLCFEGEEPVNVVKGRWPVISSPMTAFVPREDGVVLKVERGELTPREPLIKPQTIFSSEQMLHSIKFLSSDELKGRGLGTDELDQAAEFIARKFHEAGLKPAGDVEGSYFQIWEDHEHKVIMKNVVGVIPGRKPELLKESVVVGAHYDHLGLGWPDVREGNRGKIHPGADDNASGVSVLIELARVLGKSLNPDRSVVFVAFTAEETGRKGSRHYVANEKGYPVEKCIGMLNIDTVGRLGKKRLQVLGSNSAKEWVHIFREISFITGVEMEVIAAQLDSGDHISFHEAGVPAVQLFSGPHPDYHRPTDTVDKIDKDGLIKVASVAKEIIEYLANRQEPLTPTVKAIKSAEPAKKREVSIGIIPDFSFTGKGCKVSGVIPGSPAEFRGLKEGDIIIGVNSTTIHSLKDFSDVLKLLTPGSKVLITFLRDGKEMVVEVEMIFK